MSRIIVFTGKGGVGKTSVAAAHAKKAAQLGKRALLVSVDMAHNLSDLFEMRIGNQITEIEKNLFGLEIDPYYEIEHDFHEMMQAFQKLMPGIQKETTEEDLGEFMLPGTEELFSLLKIEKIYQSGEYDVIIVDCAPTGETLSMLKFPELLSWYMEKLFPVGKVAMKVLRPIGKHFLKVELPNGKAMNDIQKLFIKLNDLQELLKNRDITSIRLVAIPEKMVVEETKRNYMYLNLYNYNVDGLFVNRILPEEAGESFFQEWRSIQSAYIEELREIFGCIPIHNIKWYSEEIQGNTALEQLVKDVLEESGFLEVQHRTVNERYEKNEAGYLLTVQIPFAKKEELVLHQSQKELIFRIGNVKRNIPLPDSICSYSIQSAKQEGEQLEIQFVKPKGEKR